MKRLFFIIFVLAFCLTAFAQDIIVTKDANCIEANIIEVSETSIRYRKASNPEGPIFVLSTDKVASVVYQNGDVQTFQNTSQSAQPSLKDIEHMQNAMLEKKNEPTPAEGPWLVYGIKMKEGVNYYINSSYADYSTNTKYNSIFGMRFLPSIEGYVEYAPKQRNMPSSRSAVYLGVQYAFRGASLLVEGVDNVSKLDLQYLSFRPAYSIEHKVFYSHTGIDFGILTNAVLYYNDGFKGNGYRGCNKVTFGIWEEIGWYIKDHFNLGLTIHWIATNSTKNIWGHYEGSNFITHRGYSPNVSLQFVFGYRFNPYKFDKKKIEKIGNYSKPN